MTAPTQGQGTRSKDPLLENSCVMAEARKKIMIVVRSDALQKNGGDYQMMHAFEAELRSAFDTELCYGMPRADQIAEVAAVLCTNLDRPVEAFQTLRQCKQHAVPFLMYTLHHPHAGITAYLRLGSRGFKRRVAQLVGFDPQRYEQLLWAIRGAVTLLRERRVLPQLSVRRAQSALLRNADALICCARGEIEVITADIEAPNRAFVVPHPADAPAVQGITPVLGRIVVAGRIEARKNQIGALEMAAALPDHEFVFVGAAVASEAAYFAYFKAKLAQTPNATYRAALPKEEFYPFIASAELVLNPSFFEVTSLIDVYCVTNSIPLVTTEHTYLRGTGCFRSFSPADSAQGVAAIQDCVAQIRRDGPHVTLLAEPDAMQMMDVVRACL